MRKLRYLIFALCIALSLTGCVERTVRTEEDMLGVITRELDLKVTVQKTGMIDLKDVVLVSYMVGNKDQKPTYGYAEFEKQVKNYKFLRTYTMMERGMDLRSAIYHNSYLFLINNESCKSIKINRGHEKVDVIPVDKIPFIYYFENALDSNFEYQFLTKDGEKILP